MLKRNLFPELSLIILGAILSIIGTILVLMWNLSIDQIVLNEDIVLGNLTLLPSKSIRTTNLTISDTDRPVLLAIKSNSSNVTMQVKIRAASGNIVNVSQFSGELLSHLELNSTGEYSVILSNLGNRPVKIGLLIGYLLDNSLKDSDEAESFKLQENLVGTYLIIIGVIFVITGIGIRAGWMITRAR